MKCWKMLSQRRYKRERETESGWGVEKYHGEENIVDSDLVETYVNFVLIFWEVCAQFPNLVDYVEGTIMGCVVGLVFPN
jgi:hypothetical protein